VATVVALVIAAQLPARRARETITIVRVAATAIVAISEDAAALVARTCLAGEVYAELHRPGTEAVTILDAFNTLMADSIGVCRG